MGCVIELALNCCLNDGLLIIILARLYLCRSEKTPSSYKHYVFITKLKYLIKVMPNNCYKT